MTKIDLLAKLNKESSFVSHFCKLLQGLELYVCGGYLRNIALGIDGGKDLDVFINCNKEQLNKFITKIESIGHVDYGQYGSPRLFVQDNDIEYVDIVPFYNFTVSGTEIKTIDELLNEFDFTANAIAWNPRTNEILDPVGGIKDIHNRILRAVRLDFPERMVAPQTPISAVSVFWFRLLHYQNVLDFSFDRKTEEWVLENRWRYKDLELFKRYFFSPSISVSMRTKLGI